MEPQLFLGVSFLETGEPESAARVFDEVYERANKLRDCLFPPDGEDFGQPTAGDVAAQCETHGVAFYHIPVDNGGLSMASVEAFRDVVAGSAGPVLAYCRSGQRSSILWQASGSP